MNNIKQNHLKTGRRKLKEGGTVLGIKMSCRNLYA